MLFLQTAYGWLFYPCYGMYIVAMFWFASHLLTANLHTSMLMHCKKVRECPRRTLVTAGSGHSIE